MSEARHRPNGTAGDRRWYHDQRVLVTALVTSAPFILGILWQVFNAGGQWADMHASVKAVDTRVAGVEETVKEIEEKRAPLVERFLGVEREVKMLKATLYRLEDKIDRLIERTNARAAAEP